jgi:ADP-ribose pyrophosphatase YjhB (NUDIX family)
MERRNAGIVVANDSHVLLAKRNCNPGVGFPGYWSPFAGAMERGETAKEAAIRELFEESKIEAKAEQLRFLGKIQRRECGPFSLFLYLVNEIPFPEIDSEHTEWGIFQIDTICVSPSPMDAWVARKIFALKV